MEQDGTQLAAATVGLLCRVKSHLSNEKKVTCDGASVCVSMKLCMCVHMCECVTEHACEFVGECVCERMSVCLLSVQAHKCVYECACECMSKCESGTLLYNCEPDTGLWDQTTHPDPASG